MQAELILNAQNAVGESPVWQIGEQAWYWVDIPAKSLHRYREGDGTGQGVQTWHASAMIECIAMHARGGCMAAMESGNFHLLPQGLHTPNGISFSPDGCTDGAAVDEEGCYGICANDAGLIHRFTPQGKLDQSLQVPVKKPAMCAFGGADMKTLFITSIRPNNADLSDQPLAGGVFALRPGVRGIEESAFLS